LRQFKFDVAIDFQGLWKSAMIAKLLKTAQGDTNVFIADWIN
jgi:ADP-heptose:LPS heptosyltransferase